LNSLGVIAWEQGNYTEAQRFYEESLVLRRQLGQPHLLSGPLNNLGLVALARKDYDTAQAALEEALAIDRELQFPTAIASVLLNLGTLMLDRGELVRAQAHFHESLDLHWQLGEKDGVAYCLEGTAGILATGTDAESAAEQAARLFGVAARIRREIHMPLSPTERVRYDHHCDILRKKLGMSRFESAWVEGEQLPITEAVAQASLLLKTK
jgi:tetratricopeptide (TPR) repeat protein